MNSNHKTLALLSTSALAAGAARGAILYTPANFTVSPEQTFNLDLNQDGTPDFEILFNANAGTKPYITSLTPGAAYVLSDGGNQGLPATHIGTTIDGSYESTQNTGYFRNNNDNCCIGGVQVGGWTASGDVDAYVGLEVVDGSGTHFGWAHFIYNATNPPANNPGPGTIRLVDAAMQTGDGVGIPTGQTADASAPQIVVLPASQTNYLGGTTRLGVLTEGFPNPVFQWQAGAVGSGIYTNLPNGAGVSSGNLNTLILGNLRPTSMADYVVVATNANGAVTSALPATVAVLPATDSPATLLHRYSFHETAGGGTFADSVGGPSWAGTLFGNASLTGTNLHLTGASGCYASLPSNIIAGFDQVTVEFWADIGSNPPWTRVFTFGSTTGSAKTAGLDFSPYAPGGYQNLDLLVGGVGAYANNNNGITNTVGTHVTVTVDSNNGTLCYYNGTQIVSQYPHNTIPSLAAASDDIDWIGASPVSSDPYLAGNIYEFRVYQGVLSAQALAFNDAVGPGNFFLLSAAPVLSATRAGTNVVLSWPGSDFNFAVQSRTNLSNAAAWTTLTNMPKLVGTNWQVSLPIAGGSKFFRLVQ